MASGPIERAYTGLGALALAAVPVVLAGVLVVPIALVADLGAAVGMLAAGLVGIGASAAAGPPLVERRVERLLGEGLEDRSAALAESRVHALAADLGVDAPAVTVVDADAPNVAAIGGYRGSRLVVSTRLLSLPAADRDAAIRHALVRVRTREAAFITALLPGLAAVETVALLATLLVGRRSGRDSSDRRPGSRRANRIHGYDPDPSGIPAPVYTAFGLLLWLVVLPAWIPAAVGDRLFVARRRRAADAAVARAGDTDREGLANAMLFAGDAAGAADWPPLLDRLSLVAMADDETIRVRGASRQEARIRLARLQSKRAL